MNLFFMILKLITTESILNDKRNKKTNFRELILVLQISLQFASDFVIAYL
jgi:hypothetical protein